MARKTKRPNGAGSIAYRKSDGVWWGRYTAGTGPDGKPIRKALYGKSHAEVQAKLVAALAARNSGSAPATRGRGPTVEQHLTAWLKTIDRNLRPGTAKRYRELMTLHVIPSLGRVLLAKLDPGQVDSLLTAKRRAGLSARTVHHIRAVLRAALNKALRQGLVSRNVVSLSDSIPVPRAATASLTPEQARLLTESAQEAREGPLWVLALSTGLRQSEALGLTWSSIDLEARTLQVDKVLERVGSEYVLAEPKTDLSRRTLMLPQVAVEALTRQKALQAAERLLAGRKWIGKWDLVFTTATGHPMDGVGVTKRFQRHLAELGLPRIRFHDLRHSAASLLAGREPERSMSSSYSATATWGRP